MRMFEKTDNQKEINGLSKISIGEYKMENGMSAADFAALNNGNDMNNNPWWPLVWVALLAGGDGGIFGGRNNADAGVAANTAGIAGLRDQVNTVLGAVNQNAALAQNQNIMDQVNSIGTLLQQGNFQLSKEICECCCKLNQSICDLGYQTQMGFASVNQAICNQTNTLQMDSFRNTQAIVDATKSEGLATRTLINDINM